MLKTTFAILSFFVAMQFALSMPAAAQRTSQCQATNQFCAICGDPGIGYFNCDPFAPFLSVCLEMTDGCPPADAGGETCPTCTKNAANGTGGRPVSLATGNTDIEERDLAIPGLGGGLTVDRIWNSLWPTTQTAYQIGLFGPNWRSTYEERVFVGADHYVKYGRSDGSFWSFGVGAGGWHVAAPANQTATLVPGTTSWTLTFQNGEQRTFDMITGKLTAIIDRNGNTTQLSYDSLGRLTTVTDPASRQLTFNYGSGSYLVSSVTTNFGVTITYSYDSLGRLSHVTEPDGSTFSFQYDSNSFISEVLDSQNKVIESHTYDSSGRGLTSSRANGVEAVTFSYQ